MEIVDRYSDEVIKIKVAREQIDLVNRFLEAYDNSALVTTIDPQQGLLAIWVTKDTESLVRKVLKYIPVQVEYLEG